ncbi:cupin [Lyngbya sp. CCY1209]|uniref:cysteine dioxygenase family protein n=1 Tax=Lyngbya sp. CCY1209 TaxID=2886103 RepID=UPI002D213D06|nr:cupin [Lyngbya sp. CCY1209]MEB3886610.1 cupin [Lyngbya sp. CCY1209]
MVNRDRLVMDDGQCVEVEAVESDRQWVRPYRLYRFLTDLEDLLIGVEDNPTRLHLIRPLVRQLLNSSEWLHYNFLPPDTATGWSVLMLYNEPEFPITIQTVVWSPDRVSPIHNHGTWGVVAMLSGQEKNTFWRRSPTADHPDRIEWVGEELLTPGDILCLMPDAIHQVEAIGTEPTISFNLYGETDFQRRFEFDRDRHTAKNF